MLTMNLVFLFAAEKKLADKLAVAARSRLVHDSREKQLQAQRKRRAALFLTKLKEDQTSEPDLSVPSDVAIPAFGTNLFIYIYIYIM